MLLISHTENMLKFSALLCVLLPCLAVTLTLPAQKGRLADAVNYDLPLHHPALARDITRVVEQVHVGMGARPDEVWITWVTNQTGTESVVQNGDVIAAMDAIGIENENAIDTEVIEKTEKMMTEAGITEVRNVRIVVLPGHVPGHVPGRPSNLHLFSRQMSILTCRSIFKIFRVGLDRCKVHQHPR